MEKQEGCSDWTSMLITGQYWLCDCEACFYFRLTLISHFHTLELFEQGMEDWSICLETAPFKVTARTLEAAFFIPCEQMSSDTFYFKYPPECKDLPESRTTTKVLQVSNGKNMVSFIILVKVSRIKKTNNTLLELLM